LRRLTFILICFSSFIVVGQNINRIEYYFDADPGFGNGITIPITAAPDLTRDFTVPLNTVNEGFHVFYVRAKSNGLWSLPISKPVFVQQRAQTTAVTFIDRVEYYFDTDPGRGNGIAIPLTAAAELNLNFTLPLGTITEGFHILYYRARNLDGFWSAPYSKAVFVQRNAQTIVKPNLQRVEYFFDTDPGFGNGTQLTAVATNFDQLVVLDLSTLSTGFHVLQIRSQDENGRWSLPYSKPFFVERSGSNIVAIEYYFDDGTTQTAAFIYNSFTQGKDLTLDFAATLQDLLPNTTYTIHLTAINDEGQRSTEVTHTFTTPAVICDPLTPPTTIGASRCENGSVTLTASGATATQSYRWYATAIDANPLLESGNSFTTPNLSSTTSYFVSIVNGTCESTRTEVIATILGCNQPPEILFAEITSAAESVTEFNVAPLLSDPDGNLDAATLTILTPPVHANAFLTGTTLTLDYSTSNFVGTESIELEVCDLLVSCTQQLLSINVVGELEIYNAISPNNDLKNEIFYIRYIELLPDTQQNKVSIFNRWGALVFQISNYNNQDRVFTGRTNNGGELPTGTYFYKIEFNNRPTRTGYLSLKR
jgi:gliding motility-associated-like protein